MIGLLLVSATIWATPEPPLRPKGTLRELPAACREGRVMVLDRAPPGRATKLGDLPKANLMLPVLRSVEGCAVPTIVRYDVEQDGRFAKPAK